MITAGAAHTAAPATKKSGMAQMASSTSAIREGCPAREVILGRTVPGPRDPLSPVHGVQVEGHREGGAYLPALDCERPAFALPVGAVYYALAGAGKADFGVEGVVGILVHNYAEELAESTELLVVCVSNDARCPENSRGPRVHHHLRERATLEDDPVLVPIPALSALPDLFALGLRNDRYCYLPIVYLESYPHDLVHYALHDPGFAVAQMVRTSNRNVCPDRPRLGRVHELLVVVVTAQLERLLACDAYLEGVLPDGLLVWVFLKLMLRPTCPSAKDLISMLIVQRVDGKLGVHFLPDDPFSLLAPPEADLVDGASWNLFVAAVNDPALALAPDVRSMDPDPHASIVHGG
eukprot:CAMPEP_0197909208 /NCGR_PEP_ID=MMETSP1439-20131203/68438_1 /TAXON_ID=66791 /ORGANISM="Gonyaulax spinifera, Strain CCMP409" /LENGTH=349 /DNA_ID=CAMNT_0043530765 /DNA_START=127 /DNA_END=1173 /DNA_ORIENTATION=+